MFFVTINADIKGTAIEGKYFLSFAALHSVLLARRGFHFACCCVVVWNQWSNPIFKRITVLLNASGYVCNVSKGRTIRKLMGGVGRSTKKIFAQGKIKWKKIHARQLFRCPLIFKFHCEKGNKCTLLPSRGHYKNKTLVSHKLLVSEIKTSSQETVSAELSDVFLSVSVISRDGGESQECFEDAVSDQGWILIFNFQHFMDLSNRKSYVLHTFSSFMYLLEGVAVFGEATTETWFNWATRSVRFEKVPGLFCVSAGLYSTPLWSMFLFQSTSF